MTTERKSWFRAYADMVDDEKLRLLAFEDRWHFVALLCCKRSGLLDNGDGADLLHRKIAVKLGLQLRELEAVASRLAEVGLIDAKTFQPHAWAERQFESDSSTERSRNCRAKKKQHVMQSVEGATELQRCNGVAATPPETETETERACSLRELVETRDASCDVQPPIAAAQSPQPPTEVANRATDAAHRTARCPVNAIVELYHGILPMLPTCQKLTKARIGHIQQRWREDLQTLDDWRAFFEDVRKAPFLIGKSPGTNGRPPFRATLHWLCLPENFAKVYEGKYHT